MKYTFQKALALFQVFLLCTLMLSACDSPKNKPFAEQDPNGVLWYELNGDGASYVVVDVSDDVGTSLEIPSSYNGLPVTRIGILAFDDVSSLESITLPDTITTIDDSAFRNCNNLTSINIPTGVTAFGDGVFISCNQLQFTTYDNAYYLGNTENPHLLLVKATDASILSCEISETTKFIGSSAFEGCSSLTSIVIPDSVTSIGASAFYACSNLVNVTVGDHIQRVGESAFGNCWKLSYTEYGNANYLGNTKILVSAVNTAIDSCDIASNTTAICGGAFYNCARLTAITIPDGITHIEDATFNNCNGLTAISLGKDVTKIGAYAFERCSSLTELVLPQGVKAIEEYAFRSCTSLETVTLGNGLTEIGQYSFAGCEALTAITVPGSVRVIGAYAFDQCTALTSATFESTSGWWVSLHDTNNNAKSVKLSGSSDDAELLTSTYSAYYWRLG